MKYQSPVVYNLYQGAYQLRRGWLNISPILYYYLLAFHPRLRMREFHVFVFYSNRLSGLGSRLQGLIYLYTKFHQNLFSGLGLKA